LALDIPKKNGKKWMQKSFTIPQAALDKTLNEVMEMIKGMIDQVETQ
jgi:hypothetical protein